MTMIQAQLRSPVLAAIHARRSVSPRRLGPPGPRRDHLATIVEAGLAAPDHGGLQPWRVLHLDSLALAEAFADALRARQPGVSEADIAREQDKALNAPVQLALVGRVDPAHCAIPPHEQWIAIGATLQSMLLAVEALGFGAKIISGTRCADPVIRQRLRLAATECLIGFISVGTVIEPPLPRPTPHAGQVLAAWP